MSTEESLFEMLSDTCSVLEMHNLIEFLPINVYGWWQTQKQEAEAVMNPAEKFDQGEESPE